MSVGATDTERIQTDTFESILGPRSRLEGNRKLGSLKRYVRVGGCE